MARIFYMWLSAVFLLFGLYLLADNLYPAERIFNFAFLEACDELVKLKRLRTACAFSIGVDGLLIGLKERLVHKFVYRSDDYSCSAFSYLIESAEFFHCNRSSLHFHSKVCRNSLKRHVGDRRKD